MEGFFRTFRHEFGPGLIGMKPSPEVREFEREHPFGGIAAAMAGMTLPFIVGGGLGIPIIKAAGRFGIPGITRAVKFLSETDKLADLPPLTAAARAALEFTPFEMARVGTAALMPQGDVKETFSTALIELPLIAGATAGFKVITRAVPHRRSLLKGEGLISDKFKTFEPYETPQVRLQQINQMLEDVSIENLDKIHPDMYTTLRNVAAQLRESIRSQVTPQGKAYVQKLEGEGRSAGALSNKFKLGGGGEGVTVRVADVGKVGPEGAKVQGLKDQKELDAVYQRLGVSQDMAEEVTQYSRVLEATTEKAALHLDKFFQKMSSVGRLGNSAYIAKEQGGVFVYARKVKGRALQGAKGDRWYLTKTVDPGLFHPDAVAFGKLQLSNAFHHDLMATLTQQQANIPTVQFLWQLKKALGSKELSGQEANQVGKFLERVLSPTVEGARKEAVGATHLFKEEMKKFVAPALHEFSDLPLAVYTMSIGRAAFARVRAKTQNTFFGQAAMAKEGSLFKVLFKGEKKSGGIEPLIDAMSEEEAAMAARAMMERLSVSEARAKYNVSSKVTKFMRKMEKVDKDYREETVAIQELWPHLKGELVPIKHHYMLSRTWRGNNRLPLYELTDKGAHGKVVGYASGHSPREAMWEAEELQKILAKEGEKKIGFLRGEVRRVGRDEDLALAEKVERSLAGKDYIARARTQLAELHPGRFKKGKGRAGYSTDMTKKELKKAIYGNIVESERLNTLRSFNEIMGEDIMKVLSMSPKLGERLNSRINSMAGVRSKLSQDVDNLIDPFVSHYLGKNAASEIVRQVNHGMFGLMLGFGDAGFAVMNALTPVQTLMPEISWLLTAPPSQIKRYYTYSTVLTRRGPETIRTLEPLHVMRRAITEMRKPDDELRKAFHKAAADGTTTPRFVEEFLGENAIQAKHIKGLLSGETGYGEFIQHVSEWMPSRSEELSRAYSFVSGWIVGRDFFGLGGKRLYNFATDVTARTNFLYTTADRPRFITGQFGSLFGLFKNWSVHFTGNFAIYGGEGATRGNFAPLMWQMVGTSALAGVGGLPLYGVGNALSKIYADKSLMQLTYEGFGYGENGFTDKGIDMFQFGMPGLLDLSLQSRAAPTGNSILRDMQFLFQSASLDRFSHGYEAIADSLEYWKSTGRFPISSQGIRDQYVRAFTPRTLARSMSFTKERALKSLRSGNQIFSPTTVSERVAYMLGLTPLDFEKAYEISETEFGRQDLKKERTTNYGRALMEAREKGDWGLVAEIYRRSLLRGVNLDSLGKSADSQNVKHSQDAIDRQFDWTRVQVQKRAYGLSPK